MKTIKYFILILILAGSAGCKDYLDLEPTDKISADDLFSSPEGIKTFMANLYYQLPIEDFNWTPRYGFHWNPFDANNAGTFPFVMTDDAVGSEFDGITLWGGWDFRWWENGYKLNRDINLLFQVIPDLSVEPEVKKALYGEAYFMRAYTYFELAKLYGGVPIITEIPPIDNVEAMMVPRSTEKETWDFILATCDSAVANLGDPDGSHRRANKYAALALKSRAALYAASIAKFWNRSPLSGPAVDKGLVGMDPSEAAGYYAACISASEEIINSGVYSLYKPDPASPEEAAVNYRELFEDPNRGLEEVIFMRGFTLQGIGYGSNQDNWGNPNQTTAAWPHPGRFCPSLDLIDLYEDYSNPGHAAPIVTTVDGDVNDYYGYNPSRTYLEFDHPTDIFQGKDARMWATVILPGTMWKDVEIIYQGGYIEPDGTPKLFVEESIEVDGTTYYTFGASNPKLYSGFDTKGGNYSRTGFGFKKFLNQDYECQYGWNFSTTDWIELGYPEVLLNYAEAVMESGAGDEALAEKGLNDIRHRAALQGDIPITLDNVLRERRIELVFQNKRYWDLIRRREYHTAFNNAYRHALVPVFDLRSKKYIFVRQNAYHTNPQTFQDEWYYKIIPGIGSNGLTQNPQY
jgi:hypothetical protein